VYRTFFPEWSPDLRKKLFVRPPDVILFTSGSSIEGLAHILSEEELKTLTSRAKIVSIGPSTSAKIRSYGLDVFIESKVHTIPAIIEELLNHFQAGPDRRPE
jgi:uroporphyrinogen-III synthase